MMGAPEKKVLCPQINPTQGEKEADLHRFGNLQVPSAYSTSLSTFFLIYISLYVYVMHHVTCNLRCERVSTSPS